MDLNIVKTENDFSPNNEIYIKTEHYDSSNEFQTETCPTEDHKHDMKTEIIVPKVKLEVVDEEENVCDPLDVGNYCRDKEDITENVTEDKSLNLHLQQKIESRREKRKELRNSGLSYINSKGIAVAGKEFNNPDCGCRKNCFSKISAEARRNLFDSFWKLKSFSSQNVYLCGLIEQNKPKTIRPRNHSRPLKNISNVYRLQVEGESIAVCKSYFLQTFQISDGRMTRAVKKIITEQQPASDDRGHHSPVNKTPDEKMDIIRQHILSFSSYQYHSSNLNIRSMYYLYKEYCQSLNVEPVSEAIYRRTFKNEFNLQFHSPPKDTK